MAFDIGKFNENLIQPVIGKVEQLVDAATASIPGTVNTKYWFGHTATEYGQIQKDLYGLGQILSSSYFVTFEPYEENALKYNELFKGKLLGYLATETNIPLIQANFEAVQVGGRQINQLTGMTEPEIQLTMLETGIGTISNSMLNWGRLMVNKDGTFNPPASYAGRITVGLFHSKFGLDVKPVSRSFIVAPSNAMIEALSGMNVSEALQIPITLTVLRDFME